MLNIKNKLTQQYLPPIIGLYWWFTSLQGSSWNTRSRRGLCNWSIWGCSFVISSGITVCFIRTVSTVLGTITFFLVTYTGTIFTCERILWTPLTLNNNLSYYIIYLQNIDICRYACCTFFSNSIQYVHHSWFTQFHCFIRFIIAIWNSITNGCYIYALARFTAIFLISSE